MCKEIQENSTVKQAPPEKFDWLVLQFEPTLDSETRHAKTGQFIGRNGLNLRLLENQYHIQLNIINESSRAKVRERLDTIRTEYGNHLDGVVLSFTKRKQSAQSVTTVEEIKQKLMEAWDAAIEHVSPQQNTTLDVED